MKDLFFNKTKAVKLKNVLYVLDLNAPLRIKVKHESYTVFDIKRDTCESVLKDLRKLESGISDTIVDSELDELFLEIIGFIRDYKLDPRETFIWRISAWYDSIRTVLSQGLYLIGVSGKEIEFFIIKAFAPPVLSLSAPN